MADGAGLAWHWSVVHEVTMPTKVSKTPREPAPLEPLAYSISAFCQATGIGKTRAYQEIGSGRLRALKVGRRTLVTRAAAEAWLALLERESASSGAGGGQ